mmetsp:Transcript_26285/g.84053  ORF Transcript_26285/g.84053 Transcript_26285/m.84053 type:complete len:253 (+) Transcript_26285:720-1478(+)
MSIFPRSHRDAHDGRPPRRRPRLEPRQPHLPRPEELHLRRARLPAAAAHHRHVHVRHHHLVVQLLPRHRPPRARVHVAVQQSHTLGVGKLQGCGRVVLSHCRVERPHGHQPVGPHPHGVPRAAVQRDGGERVVQVDALEVVVAQGQGRPVRGGDGQAFNVGAGVAEGIDPVPALGAEDHLRVGQVELGDLGPRTRPIGYARTGSGTGTVNPSCAAKPLIEGGAQGHGRRARCPWARRRDSKAARASVPPVGG